MPNRRHLPSQEGAGTGGAAKRKLKPGEMIAKVKHNNHRNETKYFNPYRLLDVNREIMDQGIPMIFISTPMINLGNRNTEMDGFFKYMEKKDPLIYKSISYHESGRPFIPVLHNYFKSISISSTQTNAREVNETFYGYKQNLPSTVVNSIAGGEISVTYRDNKNLNVLSLHKMWLDYTEHISRGSMIPRADMRRRKMIDYVSSLYYFVLDYDLKTILFYSKYTGLVPSNVPYDALSGDIGNRDIVEFNIDYLFSYKEELNPEILYDFNSLSLSANRYASGNNNLDEVVNILASKDNGTMNVDDIFVDEDHTMYTTPYITINPETSKFEINFAKSGKDKLPVNII